MSGEGKFCRRSEDPQMRGVGPFRWQIHENRLAKTQPGGDLLSVRRAYIGTVDYPQGIAEVACLVGEYAHNRDINAHSSTLRPLRRAHSGTRELAANL